MRYNIRDLPEEEGERAPEKREELGIHILRRGVLSSWGVGSSDSVFLAFFDHRPFSNKPSPHQSPTFGPTLYKFIVMGPLSLDPVRRWA